MKSLGLIAEYNPLHYGHVYQLKKIREMSGADCLIVFMSGNVVQRGEFAILDKWQRAKLAVLYGADLVLELPLLASLQAADYFAHYAIQALFDVGCQEFYFGTEGADLVQLSEWVNRQAQHGPAIDQALQANLQAGLAYPAAYQQAVTKVLGQADFDPSLSNHMLGLAYLKANADLSQPLSAHTIPRIYQDGSRLLSASQVRHAAMSGHLTHDQVPHNTYLALEKKGGVGMEDYWDYLHYRLTLHSASSLRQIHFVKEGVEHAILKANKEARSWRDLVQRLTNKRWTKSAVQRLLMAVLCDIKASEWADYQQAFMAQPSYRILAYNQRGRQALRPISQAGTVKLITNWRKHHSLLYGLQARCDLVYQLNPRGLIQEQNIQVFPLEINELALTDS